MGVRRASLLLLLVTLGLGASGTRAWAESPAETHARAERLLGKDVQTELPEDALARQGKDKRRTGAVEPPREHDTARDHVEVPNGGSAVANGIMWVLAGVALLLVVAFVVRELSGYERNEALVAPADRARESAAATALVVERPLDDAEQLARSGRFADAIHALLLRTLEELVRRLDRPLPRSKTSREILAEVRLPDDARGALAHLVSAVEVSFFGGAEPGERDYQLCVERFRSFASAYTRGVGA